MFDDIVYGAFVWSSAKNRVNIARHGLAFQEAIQVFKDLKVLIGHDELHSQIEERFFAIGKVKGRIATVRFTYRGDRIRIIGAGYWRKGRKLYEKTNP